MSTIENDTKSNRLDMNEINLLDTIDILLNKLNEPIYSTEQNKTTNNGLQILLKAADICLTKEKSSSLSKQS